MQPQIVERVIPVGREIETQGARPDTVRIVKLGLFKGTRLTARGERRAVCLQGKGRIVGLSGLYRQPASLSVVAITPARVCEVPIDVIDDLGATDRNFRRCLYKALARYIDNLADWSRILREEGIATQLCQALHLISLEEGHKAFRIPSHVELGRVLGARRETVARHIGALIERGHFTKIDRWHGMLTTASDGTCA
ncbi:Crp/Fnr family transcriptional regulator [Hydrogenophaga sp.]|uniref:Crp/Fnr family transcriptional regulator n=1 Tax=Hydrogenophaga sp. TaxID=1904254 RepID=UPI0025B9B248|nr:Crp/Fnr family transcriptional regulator [Hydrogenophaga sp.]